MGESNAPKIRLAKVASEDGIDAAARRGNDAMLQFLLGKPLVVLIHFDF